MVTCKLNYTNSHHAFASTSHNNQRFLRYQSLSLDGLWYYVMLLLFCLVFKGGSVHAKNISPDYPDLAKAEYVFLIDQDSKEVLLWYFF